MSNIMKSKQAVKQPQPSDRRPESARNADEFHKLVVAEIIRSESAERTYRSDVPGVFERIRRAFASP